MALIRLFCSLGMLIKLTLAVDHVPVLLWSTHSSLWNSEATLHEGHIISKQELHMLLQPVFTQDSKNLVLFLQDTLSIDDFTRNSESYENEKPFHNIQELLHSSSSSLVLSAVDSQAISHLLDYLQESVDWKLTNLDEVEISKLEVDTSKPNIFVVKLQPIKRLNGISTAKAFTENAAPAACAGHITPPGTCSHTSSLLWTTTTQQEYWDQYLGALRALHCTIEAWMREDLQLRREQLVEDRARNCHL